MLESNSHIPDRVSGTKWKAHINLNEEVTKIGGKTYITKSIVSDKL